MLCSLVTRAQGMWRTLASRRTSVSRRRSSTLCRGTCTRRWRRAWGWGRRRRGHSASRPGRTGVAGAARGRVGRGCAALPVAGRGWPGFAFANSSVAAGNFSHCTIALGRHGGGKPRSGGAAGHTRQLLLCLGCRGTAGAGGGQRRFAHWARNRRRRIEPQQLSSYGRRQRARNSKPWRVLDRRATRKRHHPGPGAAAGAAGRRKTIETRPRQLLPAPTLLRRRHAP